MSVPTVCPANPAPTCKLCVAGSSAHALRCVGAENVTLFRGPRSGLTLAEWVVLSPPADLDMTTATADAHPGLPEILAEERHHRIRGRVLRWVLGLAAAAAATAAGITLLTRPGAPTMVFHGEPVVRGEVTHEVSATGRLEARGTVAVGPEISGRIASVEVDFNDHVHRGQVLARFDTAALKAQLDQAHATLQTARVALHEARNDATRTDRERRRIEPLHARGIVAGAELDAAVDGDLQAQDRVKEARAQLDLQRANHALALTNLEHAEIRAPIDGVVITRAVDPGQAVAAMLQAPDLFVIAQDLARMRVIAAIDEADVGQITVGQTGRFTVDAFPEQAFAAVLSELHSAAKVIQDVVTYEAVLVVDNPEHRLRPGMTASVKIVTGHASDALVVPNAALRFTPPGRTRSASHGVWLADEEELTRFVPVRVTVSDGLRSAVLGALHPGDEVLVGVGKAAQ